MPAAVNPYAPPKARVEDVVQGSSGAEAIRREHIKHEASIRSIGVLDYLGGGGLCFAAIGLLGIPFGTLINGYILYLLLLRKGQRIFAADYPEIVAATPHIKYRTSAVVWVLLGLVALLIVGLLVAALLRH